MKFDTDTSEDLGNNNEEQFELNSFFPYQVRLYYKAVNELLQKTYTAEYDLTVTEWRVIALLNKYEPSTASVIIDKSSMDKVQISRAITNLESRNILKRNKDSIDKRRSLIKLTRKGNNIVSKLIPLMKEVEKELLIDISEDELINLKRLMSNIQIKAEKLLSH